MPVIWDYTLLVTVMSSNDVSLVKPASASYQRQPLVWNQHNARTFSEYVQCHNGFIPPGKDTRETELITCHISFTDKVPRDFSRCRRPFWMTSPCQQMWHGIAGIHRSLEKDILMSTFIISIVLVNGPALVRAFSNLVRTKVNALRLERNCWHFANSSLKWFVWRGFSN